MRVNREIRVPKVRLVGADGEQVGIVTRDEAMKLAEEAELDLVEVAPNASPPVCKIIDYGKFRYEQTKKEKEARKGHSSKLKEVKVKPNISDHDFSFKARHAREFIEKGYKVKVTCMFRGREMAHTDIGRRVVQRMVEELADVANPEAPPKLMGRNMTTVLAPGAKKK